MSHLRTWIGAVTGAAVAAALVVPAVGSADAAPGTTSVVGAQTAGDSLFPHQGNGGYDVGNYDLDLTWTTANSITATATITATTTQQPLERFSLDLEGLTVSAVTVNGAAATFSRVATGGAFKLVVTPATPVSGAFTTTVTYSGTPVSHTDPDGSKEGWVATAGQEGAVALNEPVGAMTWFPNNNTPKDKATFRTRITVPANSLIASRNRVAISNGVLTSTTASGGNRTFTWTQTKPQATYLALVGIGRYTASTSDVALTSGTTREWSYTDPNATGSGQFATARGRLSAILKGIEKRYGTYPGSSTGLVLDVSSLGYALETQDRPYFENSIDASTLIHELAHQWFGNAVSPADWSDVWLNEGPATFLETQIAADLDGGPSTQDTYYAAWNTSSATSSMWTTPAAGFKDASQLFESQVYTRGAIALEALRSSLGDAVFTKVMRTWLEVYGGRSATTAQFVAVAEQVSGYDLTAFFRTWIYGTTKPAAWPAAYELSLASTPATGATVDPDTTVAYTLTANNSGKVSTGSSTVEVDVSALLAQGTLGALPAGVTRSGSFLVWAVPATAVGGRATTTFSAVLDHPTGGALVVPARGRTLGADCGTCVSSLTVGTPVPSSEPSIAGTPRVGSTLTARPGAWSDATPLTYQWNVAGSPVAEATTTTFVPRPADVDTTVTVSVTGTRGSAVTTRTSEPVTVLAGEFSPTPGPKLDRLARVGRRVTAVTGTWDPAAKLSYRWYVDDVLVKNVFTASYKPSVTSLGKKLTATVIGSAPGYTTASRTTAPTTVLRGYQAPMVSPSVTGEPFVGQTLRAYPGSPSNTTRTDQWYVDGRRVAGATTTTFRLRAQDRGKVVTFLARFTRPGYFPVDKRSDGVRVR